eukprot:TRINITY_DN454_c0_g1_i1.p1 TRINITY_DN454_c0_g1~~TRINITY_DN454_c0_g1_i1.p1  ORF type:complete len:347 (-),score=89.86 TRINITY_DN454_c0_g1_i1:50-1090(-)
MSEDFDIYEDAIGYDPPQEGGDFSIYDDLNTTDNEPPTRLNHDRRSPPRQTHQSPPRDDRRSVEGPSTSGSSDDLSSIYVGNLTWWTTDQEIETLFGPYGRIKNLRFFEDKVNGKSKGFVLIEYKSSEAAKSARDSMNGKEIHKKTILVNFAAIPRGSNKPTDFSKPPVMKEEGSNRGSNGRGRGSSRGEGRGGGRGREERREERPPRGGGAPSASPLEMMMRSGRGFPPLGLPGMGDPRMALGMGAHFNPAFFNPPGKDSGGDDHEDRHKHRDDDHERRKRDRDDSRTSDRTERSERRDDRGRDDRRDDRREDREKRSDRDRDRDRSDRDRRDDRERDSKSTRRH